MRETAIIENNSIPVGESGCWWWLGSLNHKGYGVTTVCGVPMRAHRLSWIIHRGPIENDLFVLHRCDVPCCVNPDHLFLGTHQENMEDAIAKGRIAIRKGMGGRRVRRDPSKLTRAQSDLRRRKLAASQVDEILASGLTDREWSQKLGLSERTIRRSRRRHLGLIDANDRRVK